MSSLINTKSRLSSTKSTQKVIKAMELVASSKIKKARDAAQGVEFYFETTLDAMSHLYQFDEIKSLFEANSSVDKELVVAITSDMGLCGPYNTNITKEVIKLGKIRNCENIMIGSKGVGKLEYEKLPIVHQITNYNGLKPIDMAREISNLLLEKWHSGEVDSVKVVYTKFINPLTQQVDVIDLFDMKSRMENVEITNKSLVIEPSPKEVFPQVLEQYVLAVIYSAILQSFASEHAYRRNSMETANKNSLELIDDLNLELNRIRQSMITQEISEIIGGAEALKK